jgi:hypothetical protein
VGILVKLLVVRCTRVCRSPPEEPLANPAACAATPTAPTTAVTCPPQPLFEHRIRSTKSVCPGRLKPRSGKPATFLSDVPAPRPPPLPRRFQLSLRPATAPPPLFPVMGIVSSRLEEPGALYLWDQNRCTYSRPCVYSPPPRLPPRKHQADQDVMRSIHRLTGHY